MVATITRKAPANYRVDSSRGWFELSPEELGTGFALTQTQSNPDPIRPLLRHYIAQSLEEADKRNYQRATELAEQAELAQQAA